MLENFIEHSLIIGVDEVGRGCLAGPVAAGAYFLTANSESIPAGIKDSKKLSPKQRQSLLGPLQLAGVSAVGLASSSEIDEINILKATHLAMRRALESLEISNELRRKFTVVVDGDVLPNFEDMGFGKVICMVKADDKILAVSAASIVAKEYRDKLMCDLDVQYPGYGFATNAGYGSPSHLDALKRDGFTDAHRKSFQPIKSMIAKTESNNHVDSRIPAMSRKRLR